jgi:cob(I)alamin adenosyltransferase
MAKSKIYTGGGDSGNTSLAGGKRIPKNNPQIEAYGTVDELNAFIACLLEETNDAHDILFLRQIQHTLFSLGGYLATEPERSPQCPISENDVRELEKEMDETDALLPPLKNFVLPGGCRGNAIAHICRTVCRRAERNIYNMPEINKIDPKTLKYINRLSDYFFLFSRKQIFFQKKEEIFWKNPCE